MNKLISKSQKDLIQQTKDTIDALVMLTDSGDYKDDLEGLKEIMDYKEKLLKELDQLNEKDSDRFYLVDEYNENKVIVDFWETYWSNDVYLDEDLIVVEHYNGEFGDDEKVTSLLNLAGNIVINECYGYEREGPFIKISNIEFTSWGEYKIYYEINGLEGKYNSIVYLSNQKLFIIDSNNLYSKELEFIGYKTGSDDILKDEEMRCIKFNLNNQIGIIHNGNVLIKPLYNSIEIDEYNAFNVFITKRDGMNGYIITNELFNGILFEKEMDSKNLELVQSTEKILLFSFAFDEKFTLLLLNLNNKSENQFDVDKFYQLLSNPNFCPDIFYGIDIYKKIYTTFVFKDDNFEIQESDFADELWLLKEIQPELIKF